MLCPKCGKESPPQSRFCAGCGLRLAAAGRSFGRLTWVLVGVIAFLLLFVGLLLYKVSADRAEEREADLEASGLQVTVNGRKVNIETERDVRAGDLSDEYSSDTMRGQVLDMGRRLMVVKSLKTNKVYTIYVGRRTRYSPRRRPRAGDTVRAQYHLRRGHLIGDQVTIE